VSLATGLTHALALIRIVVQAPLSHRKYQIEGLMHQL